ncbi:saccharopine dehydrogenase family protein [Nocardia jiangsuensis]|uniref:Saccharopine dehydrogenase family protein n=1 Tax=Nocardia jiangsuensis TaxID=1691563 RepID=A0ABV8E3Q7_9NOCA
MTLRREFDLIIYGATGFVGRLTAGYLAGAAPATARIALAGRSLDKLRAIRSELGDPARDWSLIVADADDQHALDAMAKRTRVVVTTVGPYARYGLGLVQSCAQAGTHYADLTGEPLFVRECIDRFHTLAVGSGAKIVTSCGFDSVPSDLSVFLLHRRALEDRAGELASATLVATVRGGLSGGTIDSGRAQWEAIAEDPSLGRIVADPYALSPDRHCEPDLGKQSDHALRRARGIDPSLSGWVTTFIMASHNTKIVRRTNGLLGWAYGKRFRYREVMYAGTSVAAPLIAVLVAAGLATLARLGPTLSRGLGKRVVDRLVPEPGTGPGERARDNGFFTMQTFARTTTGTRYRAMFAAEGDPGYKATAVLLGESGLSLAFDDNPRHEYGGVLTPASAMGEDLADRLGKSAMTISVDRIDD